jgi:lipopolysaccharide transport system permease protein
MFQSLWRYRHFIFSSIYTEFRARFIRSRLGGLWMVIHPLAQAAIFALVLAEVMGAKLPGMLAWSLFSEVITRCLTLFIDNGNLIKKIAFPRMCLPFIVAGSALLNNLLLFLAIVAVFALLGHFPGSQLIWIPLLVLLTLALALGIGILLGVFNVFIRDIGQVVPVALQIGFWLTPIVYMPNIIPAAFRPFIALNPMAAVVVNYQNAMLFNKHPAIGDIWWVALLACVLLMLAFFMFRRAGPEMADVL